MAGKEKTGEQAEKSLNLSWAFAERFFSNPYLMFATFVVWPLILYTLSALNMNIGSSLYFFVKPVKNPELKEFIGVFIDLVVAFSLPLAVALLTSSVALKALIAKQIEREEAEISRERQREQVFLTELDQQSDKICRLVQQHVDTGMARLLTHADQHIARVGAHVDSVISTWSQVSHDEHMREELKRLVDTIGNSHLARDPSHRIVLRSLVGGMTTRLSNLLENIEDKGSFMEPTERRRLTEELYGETSSYHVVLVGAHSPKKGAWKWHPEYLKFLVDAGVRHPNGVSWTFFLSDKSARDEMEEAVADVCGLGLKCYIFGRTERGDTPWKKFENFFSRGPLVEVFGKPSGTNGGGPAALTWKATALYKEGAGGQREPVGKSVLDNWDEDEGVWSKDDILKLVRIGAADSSAHQRVETRQILDAILRHRIEINP